MDVFSSWCCNDLVITITGIFSYFIDGFLHYYLVLDVKELLDFRFSLLLHTLSQSPGEILPGGYPGENWP